MPAWRPGVVVPAAQTIMPPASLASIGTLSFQPSLPRARRVPMSASTAPVPGLPPLRYELGSSAGSRLMAVAVVLMHLAGLWALAHMAPVREAVRRLTPLVVTIVSTPARQDAPKAVALPTPTLSLPALTEPSALLPVFQVASPSAPNATAPAPAATAPAQMAAAAPTEAPAVVTVPPVQANAPRQIPASAVRYLLPPPVEVPLLSRRAGESGVVLLRVLVDAQGLPKQVQVHKSSGFTRLDEQALSAMRQARFKPQTENGQAIEWFVIAPLSYELER